MNTYEIRFTDADGKIYVSGPVKGRCGNEVLVDLIINTGYILSPGKVEVLLDRKIPVVEINIKKVDALITLGYKES